MRKRYQIKNILFRATTLRNLVSIFPETIVFIIYIQGFPCGSEGKVSAYNVGDLGSIPGSGRSPGEGNGNPL